VSVAAARVVVETVGGAFTVIVSDLVAATPSASVKATVKVWEVADAPTGPLIVPEVVLRLKPVGKEPTLTDHNPYGVVPPALVSVWEYVPVWVAPANELFVTDGAATTVMVSDFVPEIPWVSCTLTVKVSLTAPAPTVPLIVPVELLIVRPVGRMPLEIDQVNGAVPPVTASGCEYVPVGVALANVVVVMLGTAATVMVRTCVSETPFASVA
jgi:hypothetical protein